MITNFQYNETTIKAYRLPTSKANVIDENSFKLEQI